MMSSRRAPSRLIDPDSFFALISTRGTALGTRFAAGSETGGAPPEAVGPEATDMPPPDAPPDAPVDSPPAVAFCSGPRAPAAVCAGGGGFGRYGATKV